MLLLICRLVIAPAAIGADARLAVLLGVRSSCGISARLGELIGTAFGVEGDEVFPPPPRRLATSALRLSIAFSSGALLHGNRFSSAAAVSRLVNES